MGEESFQLSTDHCAEIDEATSDACHPERESPMPPLRDEEEWARALMESVLGVPVKQHDDGSLGGMHDLAIQYPDRPAAAVEVTAAADRASVELWHLVNGASERWIVPTLRGGWFVALEPWARAARLKAELPATLASLEAEGVTWPRWNRRRRPTGQSEFDQLQRLGVTHASQGRTDFPGSIYLTIEQPQERTGGIVDPTGAAVPTWVAEFLAEPQQADVLAKMRRSGASECHVFVILPGFSTAPFGVLDALWRDMDEASMSSPHLPSEVTHVWLASTWEVGTGLRWSPDGCWQRFNRRPTRPGADAASA
ncbi:hypothetical protein [Blastococcus sp. PRF04-17]|uniref:hypothetical protein n=1 Tax=Blastococcus sp. PRF04-17 TaxID=2933797 RepID=UPI001FF319BB|nr:hypothetical protein [Blastococcus sp. PRF04-17]UOY02451.1 hypothetical protein MVA48_03420 [Blastococcus sp. PRF04-17]